MSHRLRVAWPDPALFAAREGRPFRILAVSDERARSLDCAESRAAMGPIDLVVGAGDLSRRTCPSWPMPSARRCATCAATTTSAPRGGSTSAALLPEPLPDGRLVDEQGITLLGFSGSPRYNEAGAMQVGGLAMWGRVAVARLRRPYAASRPASSPMPRRAASTTRRTTRTAASPPSAGSSTACGRRSGSTAIPRSCGAASIRVACGTAPPFSTTARAPRWWSSSRPGPTHDRPSRSRRRTAARALDRRRHPGAHRAARASCSSSGPRSTRWRRHAATRTSGWRA